MLPRMQFLTVFRRTFAFAGPALRLVTLFFLLVLAASGQAAPLAMGEAVPAFAAKDQFGKEFKFAPGLQFLLVGFDMNAGKLANHKFAELGAGWLEAHGAAYVLDIHTMPAVARLFALPKMRKYPHRIMLAETASLLAPFPHQAENITILDLNPNGTIRAIRYWNPATVAAAPELTPAPRP